MASRTIFSPSCRTVRGLCCESTFSSLRREDSFPGGFNHPARCEAKRICDADPDSLHETHEGMNIEVIGAGVSGNKVPDLQKRLQRDVLDKQPSLVVIYIGINDVWHWVTPGLKGTTKEDYESGLKDIIASIQHAGRVSTSAHRELSVKRTMVQTPRM